MRAWAKLAFKKFLDHHAIPISSWWRRRGPARPSRPFAASTTRWESGRSLGLSWSSPRDSSSGNGPGRHTPSAFELRSELVQRDRGLSGDFHGRVVTYQQVGVRSQGGPMALAREDLRGRGRDSSCGRWGRLGGQYPARAFRGRHVDAARGHPSVPGATGCPLCDTTPRDCVPDFSDPYADALSDGVCRPILFPAYEETWDGTGGGTSTHSAINCPIIRPLATPRPC